MTLTRRQHYVWKHYLRAWEQEGRVCVLRRDGKQFETSPDNVAVMRDFYRLPVLSEEDEDFIRRFIDAIERPMLRDLNLRWLYAIAAPSRLRRELESRGKKTAEIEAEIEKVEIQSEEHFHSGVEGDAVRLLDALRRGESDLWRNHNDARDLAFFLSLQHLRTKRSQDRIVAGYPEGIEREAMLRRWPVLRFVTATNIGWSIFAERSVWRLRILEASSQAKFITCDQPTRNLLPGDSLSLFYPIGPDRAVLLEHTENQSVIGDDDRLSDEAVQAMNRQTYDDSHEQVFAAAPAHLSDFGSG